MFNKSPLKGKVAAAALFAITILLQGCGSSVDCNDSDTKKTALEIIQSKLNQAVWYQQIGYALSGAEPKIDNVKTLARDDKTNQCQCNAKYSFVYNKQPRTIDFDYNLAYLEDKGQTEVKVDVSRIQGAMIGLVTTEPPNLSPEQIAERRKQRKQEIEKQIKSDEEFEAKLKMLDAFKVTILSVTRKTTSGPTWGGPPVECEVEISNGTTFAARYVDGDLGENKQIGGWSYNFSAPIQPGETRRVKLSSDDHNNGGMSSLSSQVKDNINRMISDGTIKPQEDINIPVIVNNISTRNAAGDTVPLLWRNDAFDPTELARLKDELSKLE